MHWTEHGGTLIVKVGDLQFAEISDSGEESGLFLELEINSPETLIQEIQGFAAEQDLTLLPPGPLSASECLVRPILAACHAPEQQKFIFAEDSRLEARPGKAGMVEIAVRGEFRGRAVPCREADLVIHLSPGDMVQLLSCLRTRAGAAKGSEHELA
jgi:hypothetical protein